MIIESIWNWFAAPFQYPFMQAALGVSAALAAYGPERLRACASEPCRDVFIDTSRNRSRRFCSTTCGNRNAVAAYLARQAATG